MDKDGNNVYKDGYNVEKDHADAVNDDNDDEYGNANYRKR